MLESEQASAAQAAGVFVLKKRKHGSGELGSRRWECICKKLKVETRKAEIMKIRNVTQMLFRRFRGFRRKRNRQICGICENGGFAFSTAQRSAVLCLAELRFFPGTSTGKGECAESKNAECDRGRFGNSGEFHFPTFEGG